jgi:hypothetical protein
MSTLTLLVVLAALVLGALGFHRRSGVRKATRIVLWIVFLAAAGITAVLLYGSVALADKGGGVLGLFAVPTGIVAWIAGYALFSGLKNEAYFDLSVPEKIRHNVAEHEAAIAQLRASIERKRAEKDRFWTSGRRRDQLRAEIERESELLRELPKLRPALERPETYAEDEADPQHRQRSRNTSGAPRP